MNDLEDRLRDHGRRWRDLQAPPTQIDWGAVTATKYNRRQHGPRRQQLVAVAVAAVLLIVVVVAGVVAKTSSHHTKVSTAAPGQTNTTPASTGPRSAIPDEIVAVTATQLTVLSAVTGDVIRVAGLQKALPSQLVDGVSVDPSGSTVYAATRSSDIGDCPAGIVALDTVTGAERLVVDSGREPAVSPDGTMLAYLSGIVHEAAPDSQDCYATDVTVENLKSGARQTWVVAATSHDTSTIPPPQLYTLSWTPNGTGILVGSSGPFTGIQLLDVRRPIGPGNPQTIGANVDSAGLVPGRYADPVELASGQLIALAPSCWGGMSCLPQIANKTAVVSLDPVSGTPTTVVPLTTIFVDQLMPGASASDLIVQAAGATTWNSADPPPEKLYRVHEGALSLLATTEGYVARTAGP